MRKENRYESTAAEEGVIMATTTEITFRAAIVTIKREIAIEEHRDLKGFLQPVHEVRPSGYSIHIEVKDADEFIVLDGKLVDTVISMP